MVTRFPSGAVPRKAENLAPVPHPSNLMSAGALAHLDDKAKDLILQRMIPLHLEAGQHAFRAGDAASNYIVVKDGSIKVTVPTAEGRDIQLYRVEAGQTCVLTTACLLSGQPYEAEAVAEAPTDVIILPKPAFEDLLASSARFRQFVFASYAERLHALISLVQEVTLKQVDRRLARLLLRLAQQDIVNATHQTLAQELNTAREVVTRILNMFMERGWVELTRGHVKITNPDELEQFAAKCDSVTDG